MNVFSTIEIVDDEGRHHVPLPELAALADEIMKTYIKVRPTYVPGRVTIARKQYIKFYRAAELCSQRGQSATEFVMGQLEGMSLKGSFWPSAIANPNYLKDKQALDMVASKATTHYKSQLLCYQVRCTIYGAHSTLQDRTLQFTPLFRTVLGFKLGFNDVVTEYREAALVELAAVPVAREVFNGHLGFAND